MKHLYASGFLLLLVMGMAACNNAPPTGAATALPAPPTLAATELILATEAVLPTAAALATAELLPTELPPTDVPAPTLEVPTIAPSAEPPTEEPTAEPTLPPVSEDVMAPGQRNTAELSDGEFHSYVVDGLQFQPDIFFVEPARDLDVALLALAGELSPGSGLDSVTPVATADNALSGRPEIVVLSPEADGRNTFVVRAVSGSGGYTAYLFNLTSPATGMAVQQADTLAVAETKSYEVTSNGGRPVIAMADPTNLSDIALDIFGSDGALITTANFSGPGGAEVAYVLPLGTATYTVAVHEVNGMPSNFDVAVVTME